jgi:hypothetical protein
MYTLLWPSVQIGLHKIYNLNDLKKWDLCQRVHRSCQLTGCFLVGSRDGHVDVWSVVVKLWWYSGKPQKFKLCMYICRNRNVRTRLMHFPSVIDISPTQVCCAWKFTVQNGAFLMQVMMRPMFGAYGKAGSSNSIAFVSKVRLTTNSSDKFRMMCNIRW